MNEERLTIPRAWLLAATRPFALIKRLSRKPPISHIGLWSVLLRFGITTLTTGLLLVLLRRTPFAPSYVPFLRIEDYYKAEFVLLPVWGIVIWLVMGSFAYFLARLFRNRPAFGVILDIIGLGMLAPMAILWIWDWAMILLDLHKAMIQAVAHSLAQIWEGWVEVVGFNKVLGVRVGTAIVMAIAINIVYIVLAAVFIR